MLRIERDRPPLATVVEPTRRRRPLVVVDVARLEHEALVGRWAVRLGVALLLGYVAGKVLW